MPVLAPAPVDERKLVLPPRLAEKALAAADGDGWLALSAAVAVVQRLLRGEDD